MPYQKMTKITSLIIKKLRIVILPVLLLSLLFIYPQNNTLYEFNGDNAYNHVKNQLEMGARFPGSKGHQEVQDYIVQVLNDKDWVVEIQQGSIDGFDVENIIAKLGNSGPIVLLGAHYDTRVFADRDFKEELKFDPVPGANDGASGVAVLLEIARVFKPVNFQIWLVFFDQEDNGNIAGQDWILGSRYFVDQMEVEPQATIILDMVGDIDLNIYKERNSDYALTNEIWNIAKKLNFDTSFLPEYKYSILDDHTPFLSKGIVAVDIIDFDYEFWHTTEDTLDKVSPASLEIVGQTILQWLLNYDINLTSNE